MLTSYLSTRLKSDCVPGMIRNSISAQNLGLACVFFLIYLQAEYPSVYQVISRVFLINEISEIGSVIAFREGNELGCIGENGGGKSNMTPTPRTLGERQSLGWDWTCIPPSMHPSFILTLDAVSHQSH